MCSYRLSLAIPFMSTYWELPAAKCFQVASVGTLPLYLHTFLECSQSRKISSTPNTPGSLCIFIVTLEPCCITCRNDEMPFLHFCLGLSTWVPLSWRSLCKQFYLSLSPFLCDRSDWVPAPGCRMDWTLFLHLFLSEPQDLHIQLFFLSPVFCQMHLQMHAEAGGAGTAVANQTLPSQLCSFIVGFSVGTQSMTYQKSWQNRRLHILLDDILNFIFWSVFITSAFFKMCSSERSLSTEL